MKPEDEARAFFADRNVLEKLDEIRRYINVAVRDAWPDLMRIFGNSIQAIGEPYPDWRFRQFRHGTRTQVLGLELLKTKGMFKAGTRIEFGYEETRLDAATGLPLEPWVGVYAADATRKELDTIAKRLHPYFRRVDDDYKNSYPIFEWLTNWPKPRDSYISLAPILIEAETVAMSEGIFGFVGDVLNDIEGGTGGRRSRAAKNGPSGS